MSTPTTDRAAIVLQQIDARIAAIAGNWPDESRALRCLKTAIEGLLTPKDGLQPRKMTPCLLSRMAAQNATGKRGKIAPRESTPSSTHGRPRNDAARLFP